MIDTGLCWEGAKVFSLITRSQSQSPFYRAEKKEGEEGGPRDFPVFYRGEFASSNTTVNIKGQLIVFRR